MLYLIGLGLGDEKDITVRGLEVVKKCKFVFLEMYTAILGIGIERLEAFYGRPVLPADRTTVEQGSDLILQHAKDEDVALLVVGDPMAATTHHDIITRAEDKGISVRVIHNASIMNAVAACGLQLYTFGQTVSIPYFTETWKPDSFYDKVKVNKQNNLHSLLLLDIKVKEQSAENIAKGIPIFEPPRFMSIKECIQQLRQVESDRKEGIMTDDCWAVGLARVGQDDQWECIASGTLRELMDVDFGGPLHSLVLAADNLHSFEESAFFRNHWDKDNRKQLEEKYHNDKEEKRRQIIAERAAERKRNEEEAKRKREEALLAAQDDAGDESDTESSSGDDDDDDDNDDDNDVSAEPTNGGTSGVLSERQRRLQELVTKRKEADAKKLNPR